MIQRAAEQKTTSSNLSITQDTPTSGDARSSSTQVETSDLTSPMEQDSTQEGFDAPLAGANEGHGGPVESSETPDDLQQQKDGQAGEVAAEDPDRSTGEEQGLVLERTDMNVANLFFHNERGKGARDASAFASQLSPPNQLAPWPGILALS